MKENFMTYTNEIQRTRREYFENLQSNKLENLEQMDTCQDTYDLPILNQENINHFNRSVTSNESKTIIVSLEEWGRGE
jgi:hypothetical protein